MGTTTYKARPTTYNGVEMRSRLEAGFAAWLDQWNFVWSYEPRAFAGQAGQYLPDFELAEVACSWRPTPATVYVEVKPAGFPKSQEQGDRLIRSMSVIRETDPKAVLIVVRPSACDGGGANVGAVPVDRDVPGVIRVEWSVQPGDRLGLSLPIAASLQPWPEGYWEVQ